MYDPRTSPLARLSVRALLLSACLLSAAAAAPSRVTLKLQNVSAGQAAARLSEASGVPLEIAGLRPIGAAPTQGSFDWTDVSFSRALRQLCAAFHLRPSRAGDGYRLTPAPLGVEAREPVGLFERGGVRLYVRSLNLYDSRWASFEAGAPPPQSSRSLNLALTAELDDDDGSSVAGVQNLVVTDDQGHVAASKGEPAWYFGGTNNGLYPDEWTGSVSLEGPHPAARKLVSVEGDLMRYRRVRTLETELPLPLSGTVGRTQARELTILVSRYLVIPKAQDEGPELDLPGPQVNGGELPSGPSVRVRLYAPRERRYSGAQGGQVVPELVGKSGRRYAGTLLRGGSSYRGGEVTGSDSTWVFPGCEEEPAKLTWEVVELEEPVRMLRFRLSDVPLPPAEKFVPKNAAETPEAAPAEHPYFQAGGGALSSQVQILTRSPRSGTVSLGLSRQSAGGWSAVRWVDLEVDFEGRVLLQDLQPGVYRVRRKYAGAELPQPGAWRNAEVTVTVTAGKTAELPPLSWGAPAPAAPRKPAPRRP